MSRINLPSFPFPRFPLWGGALVLSFAFLPPNVRGGPVQSRDSSRTQPTARSQAASTSSPHANTSKAEEDKDKSEGSGKASDHPETITPEQGAKKSPERPEGPSLANRKSTAKRPVPWGRWAFGLELFGPPLVMIASLVLVWRLYRRQTSLDRKHRDLGKNIEAVKSQLKPPASGWENEFAHLSEKLEGVHKKLTTLEGKADDISRLNACLEQRLKDQGDASQTGTATLERRISDVERALNALKTILKEFSGRDLEFYFQKWKADKLRHALAEENHRTLQEFMQQAENRKLLEDHKQAQQKILEKAQVWFEGLSGWTAHLHAVASGADGAFFSQYLTSWVNYAQRGEALIGKVQDSLSRFDFATVATGPAHDMSLFDVVSGRSGETIIKGYRGQLAQRLEELVRNTTAYGEEWGKARGELLDLLDQFYRQKDSSGASDTWAGLESSLRAALGVAKIKEIRVNPNLTLYDPSLHEPLAGARLVRPDLPENTVVILERRGFFCEGKVFRRALVTLSTKGQ